MVRKRIIACEVIKEELLSVAPKTEVEYEFLSGPWDTRDFIVVEKGSQPQDHEFMGAI